MAPSTPSQRAHAPLAQGWAGLLSPFCIQLSTAGSEELFEAEGASWYWTPVPTGPGQDICSWRKRRRSLVNLWRRGQNTVVPVATSIPYSPGSNGGEAQLPQMS